MVIFLLTSTSSAEDYGWTISTSDTSPDVNTAIATQDLASYYLWFACSDVPAPLENGMAAAEFDIVATGPTHIATNVMSGFLNAGGTGNLLLAVGGCPSGPVVAAELLVLSFAGNICIAPADNGNLVTVDCAPAPSAHQMAWVGLDLGSGACSGGTCVVSPTPVESLSWGEVKALYR
jgi:hypothetical protein